MKKKVVVALLAVTVAVAFTGCSESSKREIKDLQASWTGLDRELTVYSYTGEPIKTYEGDFDIEVSDNKVKFDLDGKRYIIYNAPVICEEK